MLVLSTIFHLEDISTHLCCPLSIKCSLGIWITPWKLIPYFIHTVLFLPLLTKGQLCFLPNSFVPHTYVSAILTSNKVLQKVIINNCDKNNCCFIQKKKLTLNSLETYIDHFSMGNNIRKDQRRKLQKYRKVLHQID